MVENGPSMACSRGQWDWGRARLGLRGGGTECPGGGLGGPAAGRMFVLGWEMLRWDTGVHLGDGTTTEKVGTVQERWTGSGHRDGEVAAKVGSAGDRGTQLEIGTGQGSRQGQFRF